MKELWEVEWESKSRDGMRMTCGIIKEDTYKELKESMEYFAHRNKCELITTRRTKFGEIIKKRYE